MFRKRCLNCGRKTSSKHSFCPNCGNTMKNKEEIEREFGLLGPDNMPKLPFGFNFLFNSIAKEMGPIIEKMTQELSDEMKKPSSENEIRINITNVGNRPFIELNKPNDPSKTIKKIKITEDMAKKLSELPKKEAIAGVRRFSNKIVYEIELPGIDNLNNIIMTKLENSLEVKAIGKDKIFFKQIPLNVPILGYALKEGKLVIEFKS